MMFEYDYYGTLETPMLFLANPNKDYIGEPLIVDNKDINLEMNANGIWQLDFKLYNNYKYFDKYKVMRLIECHNSGWFQIVSINEPINGDTDYKEVTCYSLENELSKKIVFDINGVFSLRDLSDPSKGLLNIICDATGNVWKIGHIDNELLSKYRTFSIDSKDALTLLKDDIATSFDCIIQFDTYSREINIVTLDNFGEDTNITITFQNVLQSSIIKADFDNITTVFKVGGGDDLDIRAVNPTGSNKIINVSAYMNTEWMSQGLVDGLNTYNNVSEQLNISHKNTNELLKVEYANLQILYERVPNPTVGESETDWTKYGYNQLVIKYNEYEVVATTLAKAGASNVSDAQYNLYLSNWNILQAVNSEMIVRMSQINTKNTEIDVLNTALDSIASQLDISKYLTTEQIKEFNTFLHESDYVDDTFVAGEEDTNEEILEIKQELYNAASKQLAIVSSPQVTIDTEISNLFQLDEFKSFHGKFKLGNIIHIEVKENYWVDVRLLSMTIDYQNPDKINVQFSNRNSLDDKLLQLSEIQNQAQNASQSITYGGIGWDKAASQYSVVQNYMKDALNLATQKIIDSKNEEVTMGNFGIRMRRWIESENAYDPHEAWWNSNTLLFSDDGFKSSKTGIGVFEDPETHQKISGFFGERIVSNLILSSSLKIINNSGNFSITNDGFIATNGTNTVKINPNDSNIFQILKGTIAQFYIDTSGNVCSAGKITGGSIQIGSGFSVDSSGNMIANNAHLNSVTLNGNFTAGTISIGNGTFAVDYNGNMTCSSANVTGTINATSGNIAGFTIDTTQMTAGTKKKFVRISPYSTTPGTNNYSTSYGSIDLGLSDDGLDTLIHLRSDGYARFGLQSVAGSVKFNAQVVEDGETYVYPMYSSNFKIAEGGMVYCDWIQSKTKLTLWGDNNALFGSDTITEIYGASIKFTTMNTTGTITVDGYTVITTNNIGSYISSTATNVNTGYLTMSGGVIQATSGSLWIGQNTVRANTIEQTSSINYKKNVSDYNENVVEKICNTKVRTYNYENETDTDKKHLGIIVEESPNEIINTNKDAIDIYAMTSMNWKAIQELKNEIDLLKEQNNTLSNSINNLLNK